MMSIISNYLSAKKEKDAIIISTRSTGDRVKVIGSTMETNSPPAGSDSNSCVIYAPEKKAGIVAVLIKVSRLDHKGKIAYERFSAFLRVAPDEKGEPRVDLENSWEPTNKIGGICGTYRDEMFVKINGQTFISGYISDYDYKGRRKPFALADTNLMCRYLYGEASAEEVVRAAREQKAEENALKQLPKLVARLNEMECLVRGYANENDQMQKDALILQETLSAVKKETRRQAVVLLKYRLAMTAAAGVYEKLNKKHRWFLSDEEMKFMLEFRMTILGQSQ